MIRSIVIAAVLTLVSAPIAAAAPEVYFNNQGNTYDASTLQVLSDHEGTHLISNATTPYAAAPHGGIRLTANATANVDFQSAAGGGPGVGFMPLVTPEHGCTPGNIATNPQAGSTPQRNGLWTTRKWKAVGCIEGTTIKNEVDFPVADGVTTWKVSRYRNAYRPKQSHRVWDYQFDPYVNICINQGYKTYASGGHLYCTVVDRPEYIRISYRLTQTTKITRVYPAYITPCNGWNDIDTPNMDCPVP